MYDPFATPSAPAAPGTVQTPQVVPTPSATGNVLAALRNKHMRAMGAFMGPGMNPGMGGPIHGQQQNPDDPGGWRANYDSALTDWRGTMPTFADGQAPTSQREMHQPQFADWRSQMQDWWTQRPAPQTYRDNRQQPTTQFPLNPGA